VHSPKDRTKDPAVVPGAHQLRVREEKALAAHFRRSRINIFVQTAFLFQVHIHLYVFIVMRP
jgi:hypothetical protein